MEENLYDTNVLIELYRERKINISGYTTIFNIIEFPKVLEFSELKVIYPSKEDFRLALEISVKLLERGKTIPAIDILVASIAINHRLRLITADNHFRIIREVEADLNLKILEDSHKNLL